VTSASLASNQSVVFGVVTNPEPKQVAACFNCERSVMKADPRGSKLSGFFEVERGVVRVSFDELKVSVGEPLYFRRERSIALPETWACAVFHRSVH